LREALLFRADLFLLGSTVSLGSPGEKLSEKEDATMKSWGFPGFLVGGGLAGGLAKFPGCAWE